MYIAYEEMIMVRFSTNSQHCQHHKNPQSCCENHCRSMRWCEFLCGAGPEGLCGQNRSVLGEISGRWGDGEDSRAMFVQEHEAEQNVKLLYSSSWSHRPDKVWISQERYVSINNLLSLLLNVICRAKHTVFRN